MPKTKVFLFTTFPESLVEELSGHIATLEKQGYTIKSIAQVMDNYSAIIYTTILYEQSCVPADAVAQYATK